MHWTTTSSMLISNPSSSAYIYTQHLTPSANCRNHIRLIERWIISLSSRTPSQLASGAIWPNPTNTPTPRIFVDLNPRNIRLFYCRVLCPWNDGSLPFVTGCWRPLGGSRYPTRLCYWPCTPTRNGPRSILEGEREFIEFYHDSRGSLFFLAEEIAN